MHERNVGIRQDPPVGKLKRANSKGRKAQSPLQFLAYTKKAYVIEVNVTSGEISRHLANNSIKMKDWYVEILDRPGTGNRSDQEIIQKYRVL